MWFNLVCWLEYVLWHFKEWYRKRIRGYTEWDIWNTDRALAKIICRRLFVYMVRNREMTSSELHDVAAMIWAFNKVAEGKTDDPVIREQIRLGLHLFAENFCDLHN